jgi:porin
MPPSSLSSPALLLAFAALVAVEPATAQQPDFRIPAVEHGWSNRGIDVEFAVTNEWYSLLKGGLDTGSDTLSNRDLLLTVDTADSLMWENGRFLFYVLGNDGGDPTRRTGDLQAASNIETSDTMKLYEAWYEHVLPDWQSSVMLGMHDLNRDFYALEFGGLFFNSSFGIGPDVSQTIPSIFPTAAPGLRYSFLPESGHYLHAAVYDGIVGDPDNAEGTHVQFNDGDGAFSIVEGGFISSEQGYAKLGMGLWHHSAEFIDFSETPRDDNMGAYLIAESQLWRSQRGVQVGGFVQLGFAKEDRNQVVRYQGVGLNFAGLVPGRPDDVAGIAVAHARNGDHIMVFDSTLVRAETAIEVSYLFSPLRWLTLQPDLQYIVDTGSSSLTRDAVVASMRMQLAF